MNELFDRYVNTTFEFKKLKCVEPVPISELNAVQSLCKLLGALATPQNGVELGEDKDVFDHMCKIWFLFWYVITIILYNYQATILIITSTIHN